MTTTETKTPPVTGEPEASDRKKKLVLTPLEERIAPNFAWGE